MSATHDRPLTPTEPDAKRLKVGITPRPRTDAHIIQTITDVRDALAVAYGYAHGVYLPPNTKQAVTFATIRTLLLADHMFIHRFNALHAKSIYQTGLSQRNAIVAACTTVVINTIADDNMKDFHAVINEFHPSTYQNAADELFRSRRFAQTPVPSIIAIEGMHATSVAQATTPQELKEAVFCPIRKTKVIRRRRKTNKFEQHYAMRDLCTNVAIAGHMALYCRVVAPPLVPMVNSLFPGKLTDHAESIANFYGHFRSCRLKFPTAQETVEKFSGCRRLTHPIVLDGRQRTPIKEQVNKQ